ncbi:MAG TPA: hypothetical protein VMV14_05950 [Acidimicrobiales bacterium]|nr:hypothetical protein [Acidimicrobiales bacterium]
MTRRSLVIAVLSAALMAAGSAAPGALISASAAGWSVTSQASSSALALSLGVPLTPTGVTATCSGPLLSPTAVVSWTSVSRATSYSVYESTTSSSSGYSLAKSVSGAVTWTTGVLATGSYWFEVAAVTGNNWTGATSTATSAIVVVLGISCT